MKKTITSAGLLVLSAATLHAQRTAYAPAPTLTRTELSKPWSLGVSLRGFFDDNYATQPTRDVTGAPNPAKRQAFGMEVSPNAAFNWTLPQTYVGLSYAYGLRWYDDRPQHDYDQSHQANFKLNHTFTERYKVEVADTFVSAQEPELIDRSGGVIMPLRSDGNNIHNTASIMFDAGLADNLTAVLGYTNNYYDYSLKGPGSYSALLNRIEHLIMANLRWQLNPTTTGLIGYQYGISDYTSSELLSPASTIKGSDRGSTSHYVYLGADHSFTSRLQGAARVGAQFTEYDTFNTDSVNPYADASLSYTYGEGSFIMVGVRHARNATDIAYLSPTTPTLDQETTMGYAAITHKLTAKLSANANAQLQNSTFENGAVSDKSELFLMTGVGLGYEINQYLTAEAGYNFDRLDSDIGNRSYSRNRIFIGIRASY